MFRIPHWILLVSVFSFWIWLKHLFELSCSVVSFSDGHTDEELNFNDDVVLFNIIFEGMFLKYFIIGSFGWFTKFTCSVHPSPEVFSWCNNIVRNIVQWLNQFCWGRSCSKVRMLIISLYLKQRITFSSRCVNRLINQCLKRQ